MRFLDRAKTCGLLVLLVGFLSVSVSSAFAQRFIQGRWGRPAVTTGFYEQFGTHLVVNGGHPGGWYFRSTAPAAVPFSPLPPAARWGWRGTAGNARWRLGLFADQGSQQTFVAQSGSLTLPQGGWGSLSYGVWRPFVIGWVPVVGDAPGWDSSGTVVWEEPVSPVRERWARLQWERLNGLEQESRGTDRPRRELDAAEAGAADPIDAADENVPPPVPVPPRERKPDDPPLILHGMP